MLWVPQEGRLRYESNLGTVGATGLGTTVTTGGAANTKGTAVACIASTSFDAYLIQITGRGYSLGATNSNLMVDILVGAATEEILIPNLLLGCSSDPTLGGGARSYLFPLYIPAGTRIAAQAAGQRVSTGFRLGIELWGGDGVPPFRVGHHVYTYPSAPGNIPFGTTVVPGTSGAAGTMTQIASTANEEHFAIMPGFQPGDDTTKSNLAFAVAIGLGAATEEELSTIWFYDTNTAEQVINATLNFVHFVDIPQGTRLSMRMSCSGATLDSGNYNGTLYAVT